MGGPRAPGLEVHLPARIRREELAAGELRCWTVHNGLFESALVAESRYARPSVHIETRKSGEGG